MDWRIVSLGPLVMWAIYVVFGSLASNAHGEKVTMLFESAAMMIVGVAVLCVYGISDFSKVSVLSMTQASIMGLMSALGVLAQLYAFRIAPSDKQGMVAMICGMFPILAVVLFHAMHTLKISGGVQAGPRQWLGVACGALALWLICGAFLFL
ncbi:MAG: hypothetical protein HYT65_03850 [Candidatus Yanofskybacteria bacterium]|nr:hypothetical protein [Candidatus Yanofskybacteria bacterium]